MVERSRAMDGSRMGTQRVRMMERERWRGGGGRGGGGRKKGVKPAQPWQHQSERRSSLGKGICKEKKNRERADRSKKEREREARESSTQKKK